MSMLAVVLIIAGCTDAAPSPTAQGSVPRQVTAVDAVSMLADRTVIDVRTPEEYASGHIADAVNIPVEASDFGTRIAQLDPAGSYLLYCRSGRRSALAADIMSQAGFGDLVDAGGLEPLVAAGARIDGT